MLSPGSERKNAPFPGRQAHGGAEFFWNKFLLTPHAVLVVVSALRLGHFLTNVKHRFQEIFIDEIVISGISDNRQKKEQAEVSLQPFPNFNKSS
jgi:hypothetical protein